MKEKFRKLFFILTLVTGGFLTSNAQEIGIRFGGTNSHGGAAIDGIFNYGKFGRIHADLGVYSGGIGIDALWDFINKPLDDEAFNWYLGAGPSAFIGNGLLVGASGEIGIEYHFEAAPIAIGLDWRPTFWLIDEKRLSAGSFGLNIRYVIGN